MPGSHDDIDWENMTNQDLRYKFAHMMSQQVQDVENKFGKAMEKFVGVEKMIDSKLDTKFNEVIARLHPLRRAQRISLDQGQHSGAAATTSEVVVVAAPT